MSESRPIVPDTAEATPPLRLSPETTAASVLGRRAGVACLLAATIGWGLNWPIIKLLLEDWPPLFARGTAGLVAACGLALFAAVRGESLAVPRGAIGPLLWAAFTNVFAFMGFSALALLWLSAGEGALMVYTMPVWATLLAWPVLGQRPSVRALIALALCLAGVATLFAGGVSLLDHAKLPGVAFALAAAVLFASGAVTSKRALALPPVAATAWQVALGCAPMVAASLLFERPDVAGLTAVGLAAWAYMIVAPMALCYLAWFGAIRRLSPATAATGSLLVPVVGVLAAAPILGEPITGRVIIALALVVSGVALVVSRPKPAGLP
jgi:drug/metabolite transporter (DMT)-like permease